MIYKLGSFNVLGLRENREEKTEEKSDLDFFTIAKIIKGEWSQKTNASRNVGNMFHIIALQEVTSAERFRTLLSTLGTGWDGEFGKPDSYSGSSAKGYGFIWNTNYVECAISEEDDSKRVRPHFLDETKDTQVSMDFSKYEKLVRRPFYGRFFLKNLETEIRLLNTHIASSVPEAIKGTNAEVLVEGEFRISEFESLTQEVLSAISHTVYGRNGKFNHYTFLLGDYNLNIKDERKTSADRVYNALSSKTKGLVGLSDEGKKVLRSVLYESVIYIPEEDLIYEKDEQKIVTVQMDLTSLRKPSTDVSYKESSLESRIEKSGIVDEQIIYLIKEYANQATEEYKIFKNNFDHFSYDENRFGEKVLSNARGLSSVIRYFFLENSDKNKTLEEAATEYREKVSDHIPIVINIDFREGK